jgi:hypothetical protein
MGYRETANFFYKITGIGILTGILFLLPAISFGQGLGPDCSDTDPIDANCPLDTWVFVLAAVVLVFAVIHLQRKQKVKPV